MARIVTHGEIRRRRRWRWKLGGYFLLLLVAGAYAGWRVWIEGTMAEDETDARRRRLRGPGGEFVRSEPEFGRPLPTNAAVEFQPAALNGGPIPAQPEIRERTPPAAKVRP